MAATETAERRRMPVSYSDCRPGDVRAWTLVAAVSIGYIISRGLAKSGSKYFGSEDPVKR